MPEKDELFILVHSMDKNEKGYFKKFSGISGDSKAGIYIRLFDCIGRMKAYDPALLRKEFAGEKVLQHLPVTKHYLKNMIIRALRNYYEEQDTVLKGVMALGDARVMLKKGLFQSAGKKIIKEKKAALLDENFLMALQWISLNDWLTFAGRDVSEMEKTAAGILDEKQKTADHYLDLAGYTYLKSVVIPATTLNGKLRATRAKQFLGHPLLKPGKGATSNKARMARAELLARIYALADEPEKGAAALREMIAYCDDPSNGYKPLPIHYFVLHNLLLNFLGRGEAKQMLPLIEKCRGIIDSNREALSLTSQTDIRITAYMHEMRMFLYLYKPHEALVVGGKVLDYLKKNEYNREVGPELFLLQAIAHTALKQFDKALEKLNDVFNGAYYERNDLLPDVYLLNIIVHLELGNHAIIKRQVDMARKFITENFPESSFDLGLLNGLAKFAVAVKSGDKRAITGKATDLIKILDAVRINSKVYIRDWLEAKMA